MEEQVPQTHPILKAAGQAIKRCASLVQALRSKGYKRSDLPIPAQAALTILRDELDAFNKEA